MQEQVFSIKKSFEFGYEEFKKYPGFLVLLFLFVFAVSMGMGEFGKSLEDVNLPLHFLFQLINLVIQVILGSGLIRIGLKIYRGEKPVFNDLFGEAHRFIDYTVASILYALIVIGGLILLIVPGLIWLMTYIFVGYVLIDKNLKPREALRASARITKGNRLRLFLFLIAGGLLNMLGLIALGVGLLVTGPVTCLAMVYVYKKLDLHTSNPTPLSPNEISEATPAEPAQ